MQARAEARHIRISPRKVKIVCDLIRGKDVGVAKGILMETPKAASVLLQAVLKSACANAENNHELDPDNLYISETFATGGPILKRGRPRAHGRMYRINKRTSHITIVVKEKEEEF